MGYSLPGTGWGSPSQDWMEYPQPGLVRVPNSQDWIGSPPARTGRGTSLKQDSRASTCHMTGSMPLENNVGIGASMHLMSISALQHTYKDVKKLAFPCCSRLQGDMAQSHMVYLLPTSKA